MVLQSDKEAMEAISTDNIPKLSLFSLPSPASEPPGSASPPLRTSASVPFLWEEAPGKPWRCTCATTPSDQSVDQQENTTKSLGLPPRLLAAEAVKFTNMPSPTTVLDGPDVGRSLSFTFSFRSLDQSSSMISRRNGYFGSARWGSFRKSKGVLPGASFDISSNSDAGVGNGFVFGGGDHDKYHHGKVKLERVRRRSSFLSLSHTRSSSHLLASIYASFKQVVPWRRKQEKKRKMES